MTINGAAKITTGAGSDEVRIDNTEGAVLKALKDFKFDTGAGIDIVSFNYGLPGHGSPLPEGSGKLDVGGDFKVLTGANDDRVLISENLKMTGEVNLDTSTGNDQIQLLVAIAMDQSETDPDNLLPDNTIGKDLKIATGVGNDNVDVTVLGSLLVTGTVTGTGAAAVNGGAVITTGTGADRVNLTANSNLTIVKDLKIDTGLNADDVHVVADQGSILVQGNEVITLGDATASATALGEGCFIQGTQAVLDSITSGELATADVTFTVEGNATISGGADNDVIGVVDVTIGKINPETSVITGGNLTINAGGGDDAVGGSVLTILAALTVNEGTGDDTIAGERLTVTGKTTIDAGAGKDRVAIGEEALGLTTFKWRYRRQTGRGQRPIRRWIWCDSSCNEDNETRWRYRQ